MNHDRQVRNKTVRLIVCVLLTLTMSLGMTPAGATTEAGHAGSQGTISQADDTTAPGAVPGETEPAEDTPDQDAGISTLAEAPSLADSTDDPSEPGEDEAPAAIEEESADPQDTTPQIDDTPERAETDAGIEPKAIDEDAGADAGQTYAITFDANGGTGTMSPLTQCAFDTDVELPACAFERAGYKLDGWNTEPDGSGTSYADQAAFRLDGDSALEGVTLYACWSTISYKIYYHLDGGTNSPKNPSEYSVESGAIALSAPKRTGHTFMGWFVDSSLQEEAEGIEAGSRGAKHFYALWEANTYNIRFAGNGSTSGSMANLTSCIYDAACTLPANQFKRSGHSFRGWNTKADGSGTSYANKSVVKKLAAKDGSTVTLYAQWGPITYKLSYVLKGGTNSAANPSSYTSKSATIKLASASRKGYRFQGWYADAGYKTRVTSIPKGSKGAKTLYAKWSAVTYSITYRLNGGKNSPANPSTYKVTTASIALASPTRAGYRFQGWYADPGYANRITAITKGSTGSKTLYAKWAVAQYAIAYILNGGTNSSRNPSAYAANSPTITLANPTRKGYAFGGWYTSSSYATRVTSIPMGSRGTRTLYAKWTANAYFITYHGNGATSGSMSSQTRTYGDTYVLSGNTFARTGYTFKEWNTKPDGTGTSYANWATVKNLTATRYGTVMLYAQWEQNVGESHNHEDSYVYVTNTGHKYHTRRSCRGLNNAKTTHVITHDEALARGYSACQICY